MRESGAYGAVWAERPIRQLLLASIAGRMAFNGLALGFVLFAVEKTDSIAITGALIAAFAVTTALAPARGRLVDRYGPGALVAFAACCAAAVGALVIAGATDAPAWQFVVAAGLAGLFTPPLGPFARSIWSHALADDPLLQQRTHALDAAGEESALIVSPLLVSACILVGSSSLALGVCAIGLLVGTLVASRTPLARGPTAPAGTHRDRLPVSLWLVFIAFLPTAAALGAVDIAVPAAATEQGHPAAAGALEAAMAVGTVAGSLLAGRWLLAPQRRVIGLQIAMAAGLAVAALAATNLVALGALLVAPGLALGALLASLYVLVGRLAPSGSGTRTFGWLVTTNNGGLALGAAVGGALSQASGPAAGLWLAAGCALIGIVPAAGAAILSARVPQASPAPRSR